MCKLYVKSSSIIIENGRQWPTAVLLNDPEAKRDFLEDVEPQSNCKIVFDKFDRTIVDRLAKWGFSEPRVFCQEGYFLKPISGFWWEYPAFYKGLWIFLVTGFFIGAFLSHRMIFVQERFETISRRYVTLEIQLRRQAQTTEVSSIFDRFYEVLALPVAVQNCHIYSDKLVLDGWVLKDQAQEFASRLSQTMQGGVMVDQSVVPGPLAIYFSVTYAFQKS